MRKYLLLVMALLISGSAISQFSTNYKSDVRELKQPKYMVEPAESNVNGTLPPAINTSSSGSKNVSVIPIGQAGNAYGFYNNGRTYLWADNNLNAVSFAHRMLSSPGTGFLAYDISKDGGSTWSLNRQVYASLNTNVTNARYPQGVIYNPTGNSIADSAYFAYFAPVLDSSNGTSWWGGYCYGAHRIDSSMAPTQNNKSSYGSYKQAIPDAFTITSEGVTWVVDNALTDALFARYTDTLILNKGVFNNSTGEFDYTESLLYAPSSIRVNLDRRGWTDLKIAFDPSGQKGFISMLGHNDYSFLADSAYYPILYKTVDGGTTWTGPINVQLSGANGISVVKNAIADSTLAKLYTTVPSTRDSILFTTAFQHDLVVDANGNPHICVAIGVGSGEWSIFSGVQSSTDDRGFIGVFDIYSSDGGTSWDAINWGMTHHFRGYFPGGAAAPSGDYISEDLRPQVSRTMDGTKLFFSWIDTDYETFAGLGNTFPDIHCRGLDIATMNKTDHLIVTKGTTAEYLATFGSQSHYVFSSSGTYTIPFVYQELSTSGDPAQPVQFQYINGFEITDADFIPNPGIIENENLASVSQNYPNPFTGMTQVDVNLKIASTLCIEIYDVMGQIVYAKDYGKQGAGKHTLQIPGDNFVNGIYLYTVKAGEYTVTNKMIVK